MRRLLSCPRCAQLPPAGEREGTLAAAFLGFASGLGGAGFCWEKNKFFISP